MAKLDQHLPNVVEYTAPLRPGDRIGDRQLEVLEVVRLRSTLKIAGRHRALFVAVHEKKDDGTVLTMFVCWEEQRTWLKGD